jgi:excisionase family DNA binding protein
VSWSPREAEWFSHAVGLSVTNLANPKSGRRQNLDFMLLTVRQVAENLSVSQACVYALLKRGRLAAYRIGIGRGAIRIRQEDLDEYLQRCQTHNGEEAPRPPRPKLKHLKL